MSIYTEEAERRSQIKCNCKEYPHAKECKRRIAIVKAAVVEALQLTARNIESFIYMSRESEQNTTELASLDTWLKIVQSALIKARGEE